MAEDPTAPAAAEVIAKGPLRRLRLGFDDGAGVYAPAPLSVEAAPGSFIAHWQGVPVLTGDGAPLVLAAADTALADVYRIAARAGVDIGFSSAVLAEATALAADPRTGEPSLRDLRHLPFVTIDYESSRDLDQALFIAADEGGFDVYYALADAASYIAPRSHLFTVALARGTSFYLPGLTAPMLPRALSEGLISLNQGADRRAFVFRIRADRRGEVLDYEMFLGLIQSRAKLTYAGVQAFIDEPRASPITGSEAAASLGELANFGAARIALERQRDVIRYDRLETSLSLDSPASRTLTVKRDDQNAVQRYNEQLSLLCNTLGASYLAGSSDAATGLAGLFRVHPRPDEEALADFAASIDELVASLSLEDEWRWRRDSESLALYIDRLPDQGPGWRLGQALKRQAMLLGRPSSYSTEAAPHFGVGALAYSRFSSPMREVVGIVTMHIALAQAGSRSLSDIDLSADLIEAAASAGNRANKVQKAVTRDCVKLAIDQLFERETEKPLDERPRRTASVLGVSDKKIYLLLDDPPLEVKLYVADQERLLGSALIVRGRFELASAKLSLRVGDEVSVVVDNYARDRERWVLRIVDRASV